MLRAGPGLADGARYGARSVLEPVNASCPIAPSCTLWLVMDEVRAREGSLANSGRLPAEGTGGKACTLTMVAGYLATRGWTARL